MRILVTGGAGFIGSHFVDLLLQEEKSLNEVVVLDKLTYAGNINNLENAFKDKRFRFIEGDIATWQDVVNAMHGITHVVNFAAESHVDRSIANSEDFIRTNIVGTSFLLRAAQQFNTTKFLQVSTDEVYGSTAEGKWNENAPLEPNSPYSASKAAADLLVRAAHKTHGLNVNITRCSNNYGPRQFPEKVIPVFVNKIIKNEKLPIYGDGLNVRDWLHVSDHCKGIHLVLMLGRPGETYNIGGGKELNNIQLAKKLIKKMNASEELISFTEDRLGHDFRYSVNYEKITEELGYLPVTSFEQGILETIEWYRQKITD